MPDELWAESRAILDEGDPPRRLGRKRIDQRKALDGIILRMRTGCRWNHLPRAFGAGRSVPRTFQRWQRLGVFARIWAVLQSRCEALGGVDGGRAGGRPDAGQGSFGRDLRGPNPTDRAKTGVQTSLLVEAGGGPLAVVVAGANVHDAQLLATTLEAIVVERPEPTAEKPAEEPTQLCLDQGYDNPTAPQAVAEQGYRGHIRPIGEKAAPAGEGRYPARRWWWSAPWPGSPRAECS